MSAAACCAAIAPQWVSAQAGCQRQRLPIESSINAPAILPHYSQKEQQLYFDVKRHPDNEGGVFDLDDIWVLPGSPSQGWGVAQPLRRGLNSKRSDAILSLSVDGNVALVLGGNTTRNTARALVSVAIHDGTSFRPTFPVEVPGLKSGDNFFAHLSPTGLELLLALEREGSDSALDLYVSHWDDARGLWSEPQSLGPVLNTAGSESSPVLSPDGSTLIFASEGHSGLGASDLYFSKRKSAGWDAWTPPQSLGECFNTVGEDGSFSVSPDGRHCYFISSDEGRRGVYVAPFPASVGTWRTWTLRGRLGDAADARQGNRPVEITAYRYARAEAPTPVARTYAMPGQPWELVTSEAADAIIVFDDGERLWWSGVPASASTIVPSLQQSERAANVWSDVRFATGEYAVVDDEQYRAIAAAAVALRRMPEAKVIVEGHTDDVGGDEANDRLAAQRVESVVALLRSVLPTTTVIETAIHGEARPLVPGISVTARAANRRVDISIRKPYQN